MKKHIELMSSENKRVIIMTNKIVLVSEYKPKITRIFYECGFKDDVFGSYEEIKKQLYRTKVNNTAIKKSPYQVGRGFFFFILPLNLLPFVFPSYIGLAFFLTHTTPRRFLLQYYTGHRRKAKHRRMRRAYTAHHFAIGTVRGGSYLRFQNRCPTPRCSILCTPPPMASRASGRQIQ
jgi:hypothetical protein